MRPFTAFASRRWPGFLSVAIAVGAWTLASAIFVDPALLPSPGRVASTGVRMLLSGQLLEAIGVSLTRIAAGFVVGAVVGVVTGLLLGGVRAADAILGPLFEFLKGLPPVALVPIAIMWFGIGEASKYLIIAYIVWVVVTVGTAVGVREIPVIRLRTGQVLGLSAPERFLRIVLPSVARYVLAALRTAIGFSYVALVSAELVAASSGVGYLIMDARFSLQTDRMIVGLVLLGLLGAASQTAFDVLVGHSRVISRYRRGG
jgi:ABC-type nitrate/sulfonate/bicarbonate transport system permease component